ncbi:MAG: PaaI family thioesterase [Oscillospiraceae bacterium]
MPSKRTEIMQKEVLEYLGEFRALKSPNISAKMELSFLDCSYEDKFLKLQFPITEFMINSLNTVHGGALATVMDITMGNLSYYITGHRSAPTAMLNVNFLRPAFLGDVLTSHAVVKKAGNSLVSVYCEIENKINCELIANATAAFSIIPGQTADY